MVSLSNLYDGIIDALLGKKFLGTTSGKITGLGVIGLVLYLLHVKNKAKTGQKPAAVRNKPKGGKGNVDKIFIKRIVKLLKIVLPNWKSPIVGNFAILTGLLVVRTFLSIYISSINGRIVEAITKLDSALFVKRVVSLGLLALPASFVNSYIDYLNKKLALQFRVKLTSHFHQTYVKDMIFYQVSNIDSRIPNPDQRLTQDVEKWAGSLASLYSNFSKPLLDIILFSQKLSALVGWRGPGYIVGWYFISGVILKFVSPPFGQLTAVEQKMEGEFRACHTDLQHHSEEIAFYRGGQWELNRVSQSFDVLVNHTNEVLTKRLYMGTFDSMLVKYGAVMVGYTILGLPVFGANSAEYLAKIGNDASAITRDYIRNSSLLINLAKAIGRIVVSYKDVQYLAGYTTLVYEMDEVLNDLKKGQYRRTMVNTAKTEKADKTENFVTLSRGQLIEKNFIKFENVPIVSPNGDVLVKSISFNIEPGMNCIISGPNGCGKSSLFRIMGQLWPLFDGVLSRPSLDNIFYIPQRPYLPHGTLRDQIIYPHLKAVRSDEELKNILDVCQISYLIEREGDFNAVNDWNDVLSGGEKQRMAMARLFYHKPQFAILDECTSQVSVDVEHILYTYCKKIGVTLFTVSHRSSLFKFHEFILKFDGEGNWEFAQLAHEEDKKQNFFVLLKA